MLKIISVSICMNKRNFLEEQIQNDCEIHLLSYEQKTAIKM